MTSEKLQFGNKDQIELARSRKRKTDPFKIKISASATGLIEYRLCKRCSKIKMDKIIKISTMFTHICKDCKKRFCDMANSTFLIGGLVKIKKTL